MIAGGGRVPGLAAGLIAAAWLTGTPARGGAAERPTVRVEGSAARVAAVEELTLVLALRTESGSFSESNAAARALRERLASVRACPPARPLDHAIAVFEQERISRSSRGKKLEHRFTLRCTLAQPGSQEAIVEAVDAVLAASDEVTLLSAEASVSPATEQRLRQELLGEALAAARQAASAAAAKAGAELRAALRIDAVGPDERPVARADAYHRLARLSKGGGLSLREPFTVASDVPATVEETARVWVEFELSYGSER